MPNLAINVPYIRRPANMLAIPSPRFLISLVAMKHGLCPKDIKARWKPERVVLARNEAIKLVATTCPGLSHPQIGKLFDRDATTVMYHLGKLRRQPLARRVLQ